MRKGDKAEITQHRQENFEWLYYKLTISKKEVLQVSRM